MIGGSLFDQFSEVIDSEASRVVLARGAQSIGDVVLREGSFRDVEIRRKLQHAFDLGCSEMSVGGIGEHAIFFLASADAQCESGQLVKMRGRALDFPSSSLDLTLDARLLRPCQYDVELRRRERDPVANEDRVKLLLLRGDALFWRPSH